MKILGFAQTTTNDAIINMINIFFTTNLRLHYSYNVIKGYHIKSYGKGILFLWSGMAAISNELVWSWYTHTARLLVITNFDPFKLIKFKHQIHLLSSSIAGLNSTLHTPKFTDEEGRLINVLLHNIPSLLIACNYNSWNSLMLTDIEVIWNLNTAQFSHYSIEASEHCSTSQLSAAGPSSKCVKWGYHKGKTGWVLRLFKF